MWLRVEMVMTCIGVMTGKSFRAKIYDDDYQVKENCVLDLWLEYSYHNCHYFLNLIEIIQLVKHYIKYVDSEFTMRMTEV